MAKRKVQKEDFSNRVLARRPINIHELLSEKRIIRMSELITPYMRGKAEIVSQYNWSVGKILDQGETPHCVGYAWTGYGISEPVI